MTTQLPLIVGQPFIPRRNIKPWFADLACTGEGCARSEPHTHWKQVKPDVENGSGWLERKASGEVVYHTPWTKLHKPFKMVNPKARVETSVKALERLKKEFLSDPGHAQYLGRSDGKGYVMTATTGDWALMELGEGKGDLIPFLAPSEGHGSTWIGDPEFHNAVKRASIMADERTNAIHLLAENGVITLSSTDPDVGNFSETLPASVSKSWQASFNVDYLEPVLGVWPLRVWVKDGESPVMFEPADGSWRFVIMPLREEK